MSKTYKEILTDAQGNVSDSILKGEGSLVYNVLSAAAFEEEALYTQAAYIINQLDPETADYDYLVILAKQRGVYPSDATNAIVKVVADTELPIGARFSLSLYNYVIQEVIDKDTFTYSAKCEQGGTGPNGLLGDLTAITFIQDLKKASITEVLVAGKDADDRDSLYKKYKASFNNNSFAGNEDAYINWMTSQEGIGGCKVHPIWNGVGTVKVVVIGSDYKPVSDYLIDELKETATNEIIPIGVDCTIVSATSLDINVVIGITYSTGYSWSTCESEINKALENLLSDTRKEWSDTGSDGHLTVYLSRVQAALLDVEGILDITSTTINGSSSSLALETDVIPILGTVSEAS